MLSIVFGARYETVARLIADWFAEEIRQDLGAAGPWARFVHLQPQLRVLIAEAAVSGMSWRMYFERAFLYIQFSDLIPATAKTVVFGYLIAVVASYLGFTTSRGTEGVGEASTRSVVMASILIILSDVILVKIIFFFYPA